MTEKYFTVDNHCNLYDNEYNVFYPIEDSRENIELLCRRLNNLIDENEQLKTRIQLLSSLLDLADIIIDLSDDEKAKSFWGKRNKEIEQEWEKILDTGDINE